MVVEMGGLARVKNRCFLFEIRPSMFPCSRRKNPFSNLIFFAATRPGNSASFV
jgi:hypothetical protein